MERSLIYDGAPVIDGDDNTLIAAISAGLAHAVVPPCVLLGHYHTICQTCTTM
jgi:hypothetical protein